MSKLPVHIKLLDEFPTTIEDSKITWCLTDDHLKIYFNEPSYDLENECCLKDLRLGVVLKVDPTTSKGRILLVPRRRCPDFIDQQEFLTLTYDKVADASYIRLIPRGKNKVTTLGVDDESDASYVPQDKNKVTTIGVDEEITFIFDSHDNEHICGIEILFVTQVLEIDLPSTEKF